jgi:hypothetical protein
VNDELSKLSDLIDKITCGVVFMHAAFIEAQQAAGPDAKVKFACVAIEPDGSGKLGATFEAEAFLDDVRRLLDLVVPPEAS